MEKKKYTKRGLENLIKLFELEILEYKKAIVIAKKMIKLAKK